MRIPIREQLGLLVLLCCLFALMVLSVATWTLNQKFIIDIRLSALSLAASIKSAQVSASLLLYRTAVQSIATRLAIQSALQRYNEGNNSDANWGMTVADLQSAMSGGDSNVIIQTIIYPNNNTNDDDVNGLVNVTGQDRTLSVKLPVSSPDDSDIYLGDPDRGYPPQLYPNLTYTSTPVNRTFDDSRAYFDGQELQLEDTMVLGPYAVNESFYLLSMTMAIRNNTAPDDILGWLTAVLDASLINGAIVSPEGLGETGQILIAAPTTANNRFNQSVRFADPAFAEQQSIRFAFVPKSNTSLGGRHDLRAAQGGDPTLSFPMRDYPAVVDAWTKNNSAINNAAAVISTHDEEDDQVSVGYATLSTSLVDWVVVFEQSHAEVVAPVNQLRDVVLACVFGTTGLIMILLFPIAHFAVRPIRELRAATSQTVEPIPPGNASDQSLGSPRRDGSVSGDEERLAASPVAKKEGFLGTISRWKKGARSPNGAGDRASGDHNSFKIPGKVPQRYTWVQDELSDLGSTFNEMSDELVLHYARLEERVKARTAELEESKKAAEAANASKTLFIANISHELKTPLNGIMGMCAVCMQEDDLRKLRHSLGIIYKSGDLLLHLLTDLLTFSKNSIGQQLTIDENEFRLLDISTQVTSIFDKQAREGHIDLQVDFLGTCDTLGNAADDSGPKLYGPTGTGRVRDMCLWGDKNRVLQILINLVSNSLKFTPPTGSVHVRICCKGLAEDVMPERAESTRKASVQSKQSRKSLASWMRRGRGSDKSLPRSVANSDTNSERVEPAKSREINVVVAGASKQLPQVAVRRQSLSPAPFNSKHLAFEFAVTDTGPGIPEEQMSRIFEPFVQGDLGLSKKFAGTGLGLSICAQLANLMGGTITLQSTMGVGSTFSVKLPLRYVQERRPSTASSPARQASHPTNTMGRTMSDEPVSQSVGHTEKDGRIAEKEKPPLQEVPRIVGFSQPYLAKDAVRADSSSPNKLSDMKKVEDEAAKKGEKVRVLVAEDNKVNQEVVTRMLKLESVYDVAIAKDGQEALDLVRDSMESSQRFDLVFMDVQMPNLDGIQSTKLIREIGFSAPIVALTAFAEESNIKDCYASGMDFFLPKPIRRRELKNVLTKYCPPTIHEHEHENAESGDGHFGDAGKGVSQSRTASAPATASMSAAAASKPSDHDLTVKTSTAAPAAEAVASSPPNASSVPATAPLPDLKPGSNSPADAKRPRRPSVTAKTP